MDNTCVDDALELEPERPSSSTAMELETDEICWKRRRNSIKAFQVEFRFLKMLLRSSPKWYGEEILHVTLASVVSTIEYICETKGIPLDSYDSDNFTQWNSVAANVNDKIQECKDRIKEYGEDLTWSGDFTLNETVEYLDVLHCYMNVVLEDYDELFGSTFKKIEEILFLLRHLIAFTPLSGQEINTQHLVVLFNNWAPKALSILLITWLKEDQYEERLRDLHLDFLRNNADPSVPLLIRSCFELIQVLKLICSDSLVFWEFVSRFVGFVLENVVSTFKDDVPLLREGLIMLITFLDDENTMMDHSDMSYFQQKLHAVFYQAVHSIESVDDDEVKAFLLEFRFLKMLSCRFPQWDFDENLHSIEDMCNNENFTEWNSVAAEENHKIMECIAKIKNYGKHLIRISLRDDFFTLEQTVRYLNVIHSKMNDLVKRRVDEFAPVKIHTKTLEEILLLLNHLIAFPHRSRQESYEKELHLEFHVHHWANMAVSMKLLSRGLHLDFLHKANPFTPELIRLCFGLVKVQKLRRLDILIFWNFASRLVDLFLENVVDDVPELREGLILLITFLADPPTNTMDHSALSFFQQKIHAVFDLASHTIGKTINVPFLQESVNEVREEIERFYVQIARLSWSNVPWTNGLGHFESLLVYLENLKETLNKNDKVVPIIKHQVFTITEELMLLRQLLQDVWMMQKNSEEVKGMRDQIIKLSYHVGLAIKSSFFIDHSIWYNLTSLSLIVEKIRDIKNKVMTIKDNQNYRDETIPPLISSDDVYQEPTSTSIDEVVVGFKHETEELTVRLTRGTKNLDIVPIVGMGGIGKTTLAKKLFNETSIRNYFYKRAFCRVSQDYRKRTVLLDILSDLCEIDDDKVHQMSDDDLAHMLWKCLTGCTYLIVMDDIWDIKHWDKVRASFPNDNNGSRVIFTTRINNISLTENQQHLLPFLSFDESWELLQQKIFHNDPCPPHLFEIGKLIVEKCRGLPLAIVVIAGLLTKTERSLSHWKEVADDLTTFASTEGCKDVIMMSYKRLPESLKSCFLYLGAFREDEKIKAKMVMELWIAEGFVLKSRSNLCLRKVAKQYLNQLGDTNLVTITKRSCNGGIKHFHVHDLIRDFCRTEAQEQHYLCFVNSRNSKLSMPNVCDQYRVCIEDEWRSFVDSKPSGPTVHSLLHHSKDYCVAKSLESFLCNFKLVQVLDLQMQVEVDGGFPKAVTTLIHLRYLALRLHMLGIEKVPSEISNLWNLETLLILGIKVHFPSDIWKMKRLRHVETDDDAHVDLDKDDDVSGGLPDLESFISLVIPPGKDGEELLTRLPNVRKLSCMCRGYSYSNTPKLGIHTNHLESLQIKYTGEGSFQYPYTFTFRLPIRKLTIESFKLHWKEFSTVIRELPTLQVLALRWTTSSDNIKIWDVQDEEFLNIEFLTLEDSDIEEWKASIDSFPRLTKLKLSYCKNLIQVPPCFGEVPTLKHVVVKYCNKEIEDSTLQVQEEQLEFGNQFNLKVVSRGT